MTRSKQYHKHIALNLTQVEHALLRFYAERHGKDKASIARGMIRQYILADHAFDPQAFHQFVEGTIVPEEKADKRMQAESRRQTAEFLAAYPKRNARTLSR